MTSVIELKNVGKTFRGKKAVDNVGFTIQKGTITALLGPNGAGKTTTLSMMLGLLEPSEGSVKLLGGSPKDRAVRDRIGVMLQEVGVMDGLKSRELIDLFRGYYSSPADRDFLIGLTGFGKNELNRYGEKLSGGQKRSLGFALAMAGDPDVLFFDEPTVGLDTSARRRFWDNIRQLAESGKTILFSTHYLEEADREAGRILLFDRGSLIADGTPEEIKRTLVKQTVSFRTAAEEPRWRSELQTVLGRLGVETDIQEREGRTVVATSDTDAVVKAVIRSGLDIRELRIDRGRLDEAFEQLTGTVDNDNTEAV
ncbi:ABC transporter ATP-binding protein [Saccharibacillus sp. CPCC 101409]|uniref:ABC transporter ATP-binding protein n=1 Tax=Saccharibacillus sp. CPCC 101409 TaxID=3058041 RepID=UPI0026719C43|nr:ABC transporter ATP-binding protein [Saccharibacillus sp. CPCC 101409]MDO3413212.1 ABC transporter ATP-binding protein [Saccharibacillus sp. CPCC 101409]